ncbi:drug/metabolite exporter YedA [Lysobacter sp. 5GHs7-4]|uniref:drug/metabolite exporter YedA n=1 Tax=Lysobacter sp. 5GHs7-4 TaxID=2904253 RepID=UPI001E6537B1|nr:drug/metabolite exporter YedA [Lysobacter sp. 5GHs7-4]UHQ22921.1 drug/metabolite exporter YedA [Lysobacter sp. 5GHs7-4]
MSAASPSAARLAPGAIAVALALASVYILWGSTYLAIRFALESYPPFLLGALRMFIAGALMYGVLRWRGATPPTRKQWRTLWVLSIWMVLLSNGLVNLAETEVGSGLAAIAVASMPLFAGVFAMLRGRHPSKIEWIGLVIGFLGVIWLNAGSALSGSTLGLVCLIVAPIAWAWGSIWSRDQDLPSPFMAASAQMLTGSVWMLGAAAVTGERITAWPSAGATGALLYLVVAGSIFGFTAYIWLLHHVRPALATSYAYVNPPIAVLFGAVLAGERFTSHDIGAMAVILVGVVIITLAKARAARAPMTPAPAAPTPSEPAA